MEELFPNYIVNLEEGTVYSKRLKRTIGRLNGEYYECRIRDIYKTIYTKIHQVIYAEGKKHPKHLWPIDKYGRSYEVDHIIPVKNGGTDTLSNLRLVSKKDNSNNELTKINQSNAGKNKIVKEDTKLKLSEAQKKAWENGKRNKTQLNEFIRSGQKYNEQQKKSIFQYSLDGNLIAVYSGRNVAERETGYNRERITFHCNNGKPYKGYIWSYNPPMH